MAASLIDIDNEGDPALIPYTQVRERDLVGREGRFIAEGEVVVRVLVERSSMRVRSLLLERRRVAPMADVIAALPSDVPAYVVPQRIMDAVVGFSIHRGVLAVGERGPTIAASELVARSPLLVGLVGLTNHDNVGGIFRNAAAFGASVLLDPASCDPLYRKAIRVSAGTALVVPFARCASVDEMLNLLASNDVEALALTPRGEQTVDALAPSARRCFLLGTEGPGLPDAVLARTTGVRIAMAPGLDSLNVAVAAGIALHEAFTRRNAGAPR